MQGVLLGSATSWLPCVGVEVLKSHFTKTGILSGLLDCMPGDFLMKTAMGLYTKSCSDSEGEDILKVEASGDWC